MSDPFEIPAALLFQQYEKKQKEKAKRKERKEWIVMSFNETLVEISMVIQSHYDALHEALKDSAEIRSQAIIWAKEFEAIHRKREWDGEWLEEVIAFAEHKTKIAIERGY